MKLYVVVRDDMPPGLQLAQVAHAVIGITISDPGQVNKWHMDSNNIVILQVPDELALHNLSATADVIGAGHLAFREPDLQDEITAIAFAPGTKAAGLCSMLPLAGKELVR